MAYQKQNFTNYETILTAEMLNNIEDGIVANETNIASKADLDGNGKLKPDQLPAEVLMENDVDQLVNAALSQAKASGEFDGKDGKDGKDGSDANVTAETIENALGYKPTSASDVDESIGLYFQVSESGGDTLIWDGDISGMDVVQGDFYRISSATPTYDEIKSIVKSTCTLDSGKVKSFVEYTGYGFSDDEKYSYVDLTYDDGIVKLLYVYYEGNSEGFVPGIYADLSYDSYVSSITIDGYDGFPVKALKMEYVPTDDVVTVENIENALGYTPANKTVVDDFSDNITGAVEAALSEAKASGAFKGEQGMQGEKGKDGVSCTHSWNGTSLTITSASGTSSANLKGDKGDKGDTGADGKDYVLTSADKKEIAQKVIDGNIPDYWKNELEMKASSIQIAMEKAGRNKSSFLWYTDAHWANGNSKVSPKLLKYLYMNTPMNKVNFGGDIIGNSLLATRDEMEYLYEWRREIKNLPNHHSVFGNHDNFEESSVDYEDDNYRYAFLLAPEETSDMVMGDGNYYYIDNSCEKTRYIYLDYLATNTENVPKLIKQGEFIVDAIKGVSDGWHIVGIAHIWWHYDASYNPANGGWDGFMRDVLSVFDAYNARSKTTDINYFIAQDFTDAKGKVEFCIGGHLHTDYDLESNGGIPVILTASDANQARSGTNGVDGTTTESAVYGIIADYNDSENTKITVIGVGRGTSRIVRKSGIKPISITDVVYSGDTTVGVSIDKSKFSFTVNYSNETTDNITGATYVSPATIGVIGDNNITVTYSEGDTTLTAEVTIIGTEKPVVNLFDKNDKDILDEGRINSSGNAVKVVLTEGTKQLVTGFIEAKVGDVFTLMSDKSMATNNHTGMAAIYKSDKTYIRQITRAIREMWNWREDVLGGTLTITATVEGNSNSDTAFVRFCIPYADIDNIVITKTQTQ